MGIFNNITYNVLQRMQLLGLRASMRFVIMLYFYINNRVYLPTSVLYNIFVHIPLNSWRVNTIQVSQYALVRKVNY